VLTVTSVDSALGIGTCEASRFDSIRIGRSNSIRFESHGPIRKFSNLPCLPIARRNQTTQTIIMALSGTVYRLASSMSDHTPVLFNVFEDWNEESVVCTFLLIRFVFDSNANGRFTSPYLGNTAF